MRRFLPRAGAHRRRRASHRRPLPRPSVARLALPRPSPAGRSSPRASIARRLSSRRATAGQRPVERRRARALLLAATAFAAIVLFSALPWSTLLSQRQQLSSATAEVGALQAQNSALAARERQLSDKSTQAALARQDYGLVAPGQKAYDILPAAGAAPSSAISAGHVPLDEAPVVPGSRQSEELLGADVVSLTATGTSASATSGHGPPAAGARWLNPSSSGGFWTRVAHTLEFWN